MGRLPSSLLDWPHHPGQTQPSPPPLGRRLRFGGPGGPFCTSVRADGTQICASVPSTASYLPLCWPLPIGVSCWWINYRGGRQEKDRGQGPLRGAWNPEHPPGWAAGELVMICARTFSPSRLLANPQVSTSASHLKQRAEASRPATLRPAYGNRDKASCVTASSL